MTSQGSGTGSAAHNTGCILQTGQHTCHAKDGALIDCKNTGQDGEEQRGLVWPDPRFARTGDMVEDRLTGLIWSANANPAEFPLPWEECLDVVDSLNARQHGGRTDWRMPDRRELFSLVSFSDSRPALPDHPFDGVYLGWYWSCTSYAGSATQDLPPTHAWRVHMEGGRMFFGRKAEYSLLWPVCGSSDVLLPSGQVDVYDEAGRDRQPVFTAPDERFVPEGDNVLDTWTGLHWLRKADLCGPVLWEDALENVRAFSNADGRSWRLPTIRELESLTDASVCFPAITTGHPFNNVGNEYWSSTSSSFEYDWAMAFYAGKGAVGVGYKTGDPFLVWPVYVD